MYHCETIVHRTHTLHVLGFHAQNVHLGTPLHASTAIVPTTKHGLSASPFLTPRVLPAHAPPVMCVDQAAALGSQVDSSCGNACQRCNGVHAEHAVALSCCSLHTPATPSGATTNQSSAEGPLWA